MQGMQTIFNCEKFKISKYNTKRFSILAKVNRAELKDSQKKQIK